MPDFQWDLPNPFTVSFPVVAAEIDEYDHVNNAEYLRWLDRCAWGHSTALGLPVGQCKQLDRGMAVRKSTLEYLSPALLGDAIAVGTWIVENDARLRVHRKFQVIATNTGKTLLRADIEYVCLVLSTGRPTRMPPEFLQRYTSSTL